MKYDVNVSERQKDPFRRRFRPVFYKLFIHASICEHTVSVIATTLLFKRILTLATRTGANNLEQTAENARTKKLWLGDK